MEFMDMCNSVYQRCVEEICHVLHDVHLAVRMRDILELNINKRSNLCIRIK